MDPLTKMQLATADPEKRLAAAGAASLILPTVQPKFPPLNLRPIGVSVLLDVPDQTKDITEGGIIVPGPSRKGMNRIMVVEVLAVGKDVSTLKAGDKVLINCVELDPVVYDNRAYWLTTPASIRAVVES